MKKCILFLTFLAFVSLGFGQNKNLNIDLNFPIPVGDNFIGKNYNGMFDIGLKKNLKNFNEFSLGYSINTGMIRYAFSADNKIKVLMLKPRLNVEREFNKLNVYVGLGYSLFKYFSSADVDDDTNDGLNLNLGIRYNFTSRVYANLGYDFIRFRTEKMSNTSYNRNISVLELGVGLTFE